jgi:hypothetical protein
MAASVLAPAGRQDRDERDAIRDGPHARQRVQAHIEVEQQHVALRHREHGGHRLEPIDLRHHDEVGLQMEQ